MARLKRKRRKARHGEKMIELAIRFWTNDISTKPGYVVKKECWDSGVVRMKKNRLHGIRADSDPIPFNSLLDLPSKIERVLIDNRITLHLGDRSRKFIRG